jgi:hypothetical protein
MGQTPRKEIRDCRTSQLVKIFAGNTNTNSTATMDQRPPKRQWQAGPPGGPLPLPATPTQEDQIAKLTAERDMARLELTFVRQELAKKERRMGLQEESLTRLYEQLTEARDIMINDRSFGRISFLSEPPSSPQ